MSPLRRKFRLRSRGSCFSILLNPQWSQYDPETDTISSSNTRSRNSELTPWCALHCTLMVTAKGSICRPQFFKFMVANPLSVWTKGMIYFDQDITYLETCLENHTKSTLYMGQIEFEPSQNWSATLLKPDEHQMEIISPPREIFKAPILIRSGGIQNYLYRLQSSSQGSGPLKQEGGNVLGKLQITWQTNLGEPGRLQTQQILGTVSALNFREGNCYELLGDSLHVPVNRPLLMVFFRKMLGQRYAVEWGAVQDACCNMLLHESYYLDLKSNSAAISWQDVDLRILDIPAAIRLGRSFPVHFNLMNLTDRELGPFKVLISENDFPDKRAVMVNGPHKKNLIATKLGVQKIGGITVFGTIEKKTYEHLPELEAF